METFSALLAICAGNSPGLVIYLICAWMNESVNNGEAGDLRRHRAHYDATVMIFVHELRFQPVPSQILKLIEVANKYSYSYFPNKKVNGQELR